MLRHCWKLHFINKRLVITMMVLLPEQKKLLSREGEGYEECVVLINADVQKFNSQSDANFALRAEIDGSRRKRHGESVSISGETNVSSNIQLLGWYPHSDGDYFSKIIPNIFEIKFDELNRVLGKFSLPSAEAGKLYPMLR